MSFVYPGFLLGLLAIAIPVIIHLFNFRRFKKIAFTNVRFLKEIKQETRAKSKLKHLLVLAARISAIAFLVFAFAQPYLPVEEGKTITGKQAISIFVDNSFSMEAENENGRLFDQAGEYALEIARSFQPTDDFQLLTNDFEGRHQRRVNREELLELVEENDISPSVKKISEIITRQQEALKNSEAKRKTLFIISDFQQSITDISQLENDTNFTLRLVPLQSEKAANLYIDSCWFETPIRQLNQPEELKVRVKNISDQQLEDIPLKLTINGQQKALASFSIEPDSHAETTLFFTVTEPGIHAAEIAITDYPVTFDDKFFLSWEVAEHIPVLSIYPQGEKERTGKEGNSFINSLFGKDPFFVLTQVQENQVDYSRLTENKLIILADLNSISSGMAQELKKFVHDGGHLIMFPGTDIDFETYQQFLLSLQAGYYTELDSNDTKVSKINMEHRIYEQVFEKIPENMDLPVIKSHYKLSSAIRTNEESLMSLLPGGSFLSRFTYSQGALYLSAVPLHEDFSNWTRHAVFVPTMLKIALHSQRAGRLYYTIGKDEMIALHPHGPSNDLSQNDHMYHIISEDETMDFIPEQQRIGAKTQLYLHGQIREAGNYKATSEKEIIAGISLNYDRKESELSCFNNEELETLYKEAGIENISILNSDYQLIGKSVQDAIRGKQLWKFCIILVLAFLGAEVLLLRFL